MSSEGKIRVSQDEMAVGPMSSSNEQVIGGVKGHHNKLKSRHLYMIAMGGKDSPSY